MELGKVVLVTGATGKQGGTVARALLKAGFRVRALTRRPEKAVDLSAAGAQVVQGDFEDRSSLAAALKDADGVFAMSTPFEAGLQAEVSQGMTLVAAAQAARVPHLVFTSVASADRGTGIPHFETKARIEAYLKGMAVPYTILRPVWFMENFGTWLLPFIMQGDLPAPVKPETCLQMVALKDIGRFAAAAFSDPKRFLGKEIDLAGDALTFPAVADILSQVMLRSVLFRRIPPEAAERAVGRDFALMYRWFDETGYDVDIQALEKAYGFTPTTFPEFLAAAEWARPAAVGTRS
ncbi:MAG: NmrA/HSCARG family protein [Elusimicrobia bacterium]|nr:NmrA/HSCARG family protein [Elusimicrobiota bacterium]